MGMIRVSEAAETELRRRAPTSTVQPGHAAMNDWLRAQFAR